MGMVEGYGEQPKAKTFEEMAEQEEATVDTTSEETAEEAPADAAE